jgi:hypothetical protein
MFARHGVADAHRGIEQRPAERCKIDQREHFAKIYTRRAILLNLSLATVDRAVLPRVQRRTMSLSQLSHHG